MRHLSDRSCPSDRQPRPSPPPWPLDIYRANGLTGFPKAIEATADQMDNFELEHGERYPGIVKAWSDAWKRFIPKSTDSASIDRKRGSSICGQLPAIADRDASVGCPRKIIGCKSPPKKFPESVAGTTWNCRLVGPPEFPVLPLQSLHRGPFVGGKPGQSVPDQEGSRSSR